MSLKAEIAACRICAEHLPHGVRPVASFSSTARLLIIGQARIANKPVYPLQHFGLRNRLITQQLYQLQFNVFRELVDFAGFASGAFIGHGFFFLSFSNSARSCFLTRGTTA